MQFRHPESYRILTDGRILQDPMGSDIGSVDLGTSFNINFLNFFKMQKNNILNLLKMINIPVTIVVII